MLGEGAIRWAYQSLSGKLCSPFVFGSGLLSHLAGWYCDSGWSRRKIAPTIAELGIDTAEFVQAADSYTSFNDFFTRQLKPEAATFRIKQMI